MPDANPIQGREEPVREEAGEGASRAGSFAALVEQHSQFVFRIALAITRHASDAEDVVQETFLQVYRGDRWKRIEDERGYLARVAWRLAVRQQRPRKREQELLVEQQSRQANPEESAMDRQLESWLHERIGALPEKLRQPLALLGGGGFEAGGNCRNARPARGNRPAQGLHGAAKAQAGLAGAKERSR
jgi:RNA polymerase sigma-70 factor (ECF subfamily)